MWWTQLLMVCAFVVQGCTYRSTCDKCMCELDKCKIAHRSRQYCLVYFHWLVCDTYTLAPGTELAHQVTRGRGMRTIKTTRNFVWTSRVSILFSCYVVADILNHVQMVNVSFWWSFQWLSVEGDTFTLIIMALCNAQEDMIRAERATRDSRRSLSRGSNSVGSSKQTRLRALIKEDKTIDRAIFNTQDKLFLTERKIASFRPEDVHLMYVLRSNVREWVFVQCTHSCASMCVCVYACIRVCVW